VQNTDLQQLIVAVAIAWAVAYGIKTACAARELVRFKARRVGVALVAFVGAAVYLQGRLQSVELTLVAVAVGIATAFVLVDAPKRSRYIPRHVREAVVRRDLKEGDRRKDFEFDHIVPWSKGGDNSVENVRLLHRTKNRAKRAKMPRISDFN
jgi:hypothetical protein